MRRSSTAAWLSAVLLLALMASLTGCAHRPRQTGVPIDQRPTPPQPPPEEAGNPGSSAATPPPPSSGSSLGTTMTDAEREQARQRIIADTTAASAAVRKCAASKSLLPDQESVFETTRGYLVQARAALKRNELWQAESLARKARQLALSLECH